MQPGVNIEDIKAEVLGQLGELESESEVVYCELVLPKWGSSDRHGFPRTLYGYVMATFSFVDLLSLYRYPDHASQTARMRRLLVDYVGASEEATAVAVKLWRHTLMHRGNPRPLVEKSSGKRYLWLLQWGGEHLPRHQHMDLQRPCASEEILNTGLLYLVEDLRSGAERLFADVGGSDSLREQALQVHAEISAPDL